MSVLYKNINSFWGKTIWGNYGKRVKYKSMKWHTQKGDYCQWLSRELWTLRPKFWTSQIWTLINNFVIVSVFARCSKLITLEENKISVQQLIMCLPLFFVFSSKVLNSGIRSCFDRVVFQDVVCEEYFSIRLRCLYL